MISLIDYFHENEIDCKHCKNKCPQRGKDENTMGVYVDSIWYAGFRCNNHSDFEPYSNLLICLCKYKDLRIAELEKENARLSQMLEMAMADALSQSHYAECNGSVYGLNCSNIEEYRAKLEKRVENKE